MTREERKEIKAYERYMFKTMWKEMKALGKDMDEMMSMNSKSEASLTIYKLMKRRAHKIASFKKEIRRFDEMKEINQVELIKGMEGLIY